MSTQSQPEDLTRRVYRALGWPAATLLLLLLAHAATQAEFHSPIVYFNLHLGLALATGIIAVMAWCTRQLLRGCRKSDKRTTAVLGRIEDQALTLKQVKEILQEVLQGALPGALQEALDEGHIAGLAGALDDLEMRSNPSNN